MDVEAQLKTQQGRQLIQAKLDSVGFDFDQEPTSCWYLPKKQYANKKVLIGNIGKISYARLVYLATHFPAADEATATATATATSAAPYKYRRLCEDPSCVNPNHYLVILDEIDEQQVAELLKTTFGRVLKEKMLETTTLQQLIDKIKEEQISLAQIKSILNPELRKPSMRGISTAQSIKLTSEALMETQDRLGRLGRLLSEKIHEELIKGGM